MKIQLKFIITTILSALAMLLLSVLWHAQILHDFQGLLFTFNQVCVGLSVFYSALALFLLLIINYKWEQLNLTKSVLISCLFGICLYIVATLLGHTFNDSHTKTQYVIDIAWQCVEQGTGGFIIYSLLNIGYKEKK
jgi:hypothetical protein